MSRIGAVLGVACGCLVVPRDAFAQEPPPAALPSPPPPPPASSDPAFQYKSSVPRDYIRAAIQEVLVIAAGVLEYNTNTNNVEDQNLGYAWKDFRGKLVFDSIAFDNNRFGTNWLTHPGAGFMYYQAARSNRLSVLESFAISVATATFWELVVEFREKVAANDLVATPVSGLPLGEATIQLGSFFQRSQKSPATTAAGWLFAPVKSIDDRIDGITPLPSTNVDDAGLDADAWHRFRLGGAAGVTVQRDGRPYSDGRLTADTRLVTLQGYAKQGDYGGAFSAAEVSTIHLDAATSLGRLVDFSLGASVMPAGYYVQHAGIDRRGRLKGHGFLTGLDVGVEYTHHDWDRSIPNSGAANLIAGVQAGLKVEHSLYAGAVALRSTLDTLFTFDGVEALAAPDYRALRQNEGLSSVMAKYQYYHGYGTTLHPRVEASIDRYDASAEMRIDLYQAIRGFDSEGVIGGGEELAPSDSRTTSRVVFGVSPGRHVRLHVDAERRTRAGRVGSVTASSVEHGVYGGAEVVF